MKHYIIVFAFIFLGVQGLLAQDVYDIGTYSGSFSFTDVQNTNLYTDHNGNGMPDVMYKVTISSTMNMSISTCNSQMDATHITVVNVTGGNVDITNEWVQDTGACSNSDQASLLHNNLMQGIYYFIVEGTYSNGYVCTSITGTASAGGQIGDTMNNPIDVGTQDPGFSYCDTQNTAVSFNDNYGQPSNDVYYRFTLSQAMTVELSHRSSGVSDTYIHLLDASGTLISENNDYSEAGTGVIIQQAYLKQELQAGTYYVVSEGIGSADGSITTWIQGVKASSSEKSVESGSSTQNYIFTITPTVASTVGDRLSTDGCLQTIKYFDGLGRPTQTVQGYITPDGADLVSAIEYDGFGRDCRHWLPGVAANNGGAYVSDFGAKASSANGGDTKPYTETMLESSPLNRPLGQHQPGADWYAHPTGIDYKTNDGSILYFYVNSNNQLAKGSNYAAGMLFVTQATDEDGKVGYEFKDKQGRVILKRQMLGGSNVDTYYVYNDLGQLCYVLPPKAVDELTADLSDGNTIIKQYCYLYQYDYRGNCTYKRLPGCEPIFMVYDKAYRLILSQDGNQRAKSPTRWTVSKYDQFGRVIFTGLTNSITASQTDLINSYKNDLVVETFSSGAYTNNKFSDATPLTINYYDTYSFISNGTLNYDSSMEQSGYTAQHSTAKGLLTGTRVYHLNDPNASETTALYYDKYGRVVQSRATNHLGGYDLVYNQLDFTGKPIRTYKTHNIAGQASVDELYTYGYNKAQQPTTTTYSLNGGGAITLVANGYDELGRLKTKKLGGIETTTYSYNVRGWTTDIIGSRFSENLYYNVNPLSSNVYYNGNISGMQWDVPNEGIGHKRAYSFVYDNLNRLTNANYCGFSGGIVSGTSGRYNETFGFDKMGNTTSFTRNGLLSSSGGYGTIDNLSFTYNGNQKLKITDAGTNGIFYGDEEFVQNGTNTGNSCAYDANGNRLYDSNSNIWGIRYNTLNLPDAMQFYQGHQTNYTYSASGAKLKVIDKTAPEGVVLPVTSLNTIISNPSLSTITTTDYVGNIIYENGTLKRILTSVGYWQDGTYYYFLKDHLGSNRVVMTGSGGIAETSSYYPSGMRFGESAVNGGNVQPYRHTGHEMQEMHGLNWIDNLARFRTVSDGSGFTGVDPLAEKFYNTSPYVYCHNNPINRVDPDGMDDSTGTPSKKNKNGVDTTPQSTTAVNQTIVDPVKIKSGQEVYIKPQESTLHKVLYWEGGHADPANQQTPSQWTEQDKAVGGGIIGAIASLTGLGELYALGVGTMSYILPTVGLLNSVDDMGTNKNGESLSQQQTNNPKAKEVISTIKGVVSLAGAGSALSPATLKSVPRTVSGVLDVSSSYNFLILKAKPLFFPITNLKPQHR